MVLETLQKSGGGSILFLNIKTNVFYRYKSKENVKDKEHLTLRCLVQVGFGPEVRHITIGLCDLFSFNKPFWKNEFWCDKNW